MEAAALMFAGTAISVFGQAKEAGAVADKERDAANLKRIEAKEILDRAQINEQALMSEEEQLIANQVGGYAAGNVDVTQGSPLITMQNTHAFYKREIANMNREAKFRATQDLRTASSYDEAASATSAALPWKVAGTVITGAATAYNIARGPQKTGA